MSNKSWITGKDVETGDGPGFNRKANKFAGNQVGGKPGGNYGMGPRKGNTTGKEAFPSTAGQSKNPVKSGSNTVKKFGNAEKINIGAGPRKGNQV